MHDRPVELVDLVRRGGDDRHNEAGVALQAALQAVQQAELRFVDGHAVLLQQKLQEPGVNSGVRGVLRHVLLGEGADEAGSGDDNLGGARARHFELGAFDLGVCRSMQVKVFKGV